MKCERKIRRTSGYPADLHNAFRGRPLRFAHRTAGNINENLGSYSRGGDHAVPSACSTAGGDIGRVVRRLPVAARIAFATAASGGTIGASPTPRTP